jgi:hypothetical protein
VPAYRGRRASSHFYVPIAMSSVLPRFAERISLISRLTLKCLRKITSRTNARSPFFSPINVRMTLICMISENHRITCWAARKGTAW